MKIKFEDENHAGECPKPNLDLKIGFSDHIEPKACFRLVFVPWILIKIYDLLFSRMCAHKGTLRMSMSNIVSDAFVIELSASIKTGLCKSEQCL